MRKKNLYINKKELIDNWWLNLGDVTEIKTTNIIGAHPLWKENPTKALIDLMRRPENFGYTCKLLFNIQLHPLQVAILKMLWEHPFSILIATRGGSKCVTGDSIVMLDNKICRINDIIEEDFPINTQLFCNYNIFGENGFKTPSYCWNNGITNNIDIETVQGYSLSGTQNHPIRSCDNKNIIWKEMKDCKINDYILIDRTESWITNPSSKLEVDESYLLGLLVGDGGYTIRGRISFTTNDIELADSVIKYSEKYFGKAFRKVKAKYTYMLWGVKLWDRLFQYYGFNSSICGEKDIPTSVLESSKDVAKAFLQGLFDTDGCVYTAKGSVGYCAKSVNIVKMVQFLLTRFGIISKVKAKLNKVYNRYYYHLNISGKNARKFCEKIGFRLTRKQNLLNKFQYKTTNDNIDKIPSILLKDKLISLRKKYIKVRDRAWFRKHSYITPWYLNKYELTYDKLKQILDLLLIDGKKLNIELDQEYIFVKEIYDRNYFFDKVGQIKSSNDYTYDFYIPDDHSFISNGIISHNSFMLSLYALLRCIFIPGTKVMFVGSAFRQSKIVFSYCESIWNNAPIFKDIFLSKRENKAVHDNDMYRFHLETSTITAIPLGTGDKVRGQRSTCLHPNTIIETDIGLMRLHDYQKYININPSMYTGNDKLPLEKPSHFIITPPIESYYIKTSGGYDFICSNIHEVMTINGFKLAKNLIPNKDYLLFQNSYKFPDKNIFVDNYELDENMAWVIGLCLAEGYIAKGGIIKVKMTDKNCLDMLEQKIKIIQKKYNLDFHIGRYEQSERVDKRGWISKPCYEVGISNEHFRNILFNFGLERKTARFKTIPWSILMSPKNIVLSFLSAIMEGDGTCFYFKSKQSFKNLGLAYYTSSKQLADEVHLLFLKLGIFTGKGSRKSKLSENLQYHIRAYGMEAIELYKLLNVEKWKEFNDNYYILKHPHGKKNKLEVLEVIKLDKLLSLCDVTMPHTHSFYGGGFIQHNCTISDEFNTLNEEVYQEVIEPFSAVSINPIEQVQDRAKQEAMLQLGNINQAEFESIQNSKIYNQQIISGTCGFTFQPLYRAWKKYHDIIMSGGDPKKLEAIFNGDVPIGLNYKDYCIIRIPYDLMPKNYMDEKNIGKAKAMTHVGLFNSEYGATFLSDSNGFFKRTLIENCICGKPKTPIIKKGGVVDFGVSLIGNPNAQYVMGIDPAAESDNFAIVILEIHEDHRRIVYSWTTNNLSHKIRLKQGLIKENVYYEYCARKIRDLMKLYKIEAIAIDAQGGGKAISEILGSPQYLEAGEHPLYPEVDLEKPKDTDHLAGLHILRLIEFANANWVYDANHALRQDMETRELIFPPCDSLSFGLAHELDKLNNRVKPNVLDKNDDLKDLTYTRQETAEDCLLEIEELKTELVLIEHTKTPNGRDRWDTPNVKGLNSKKGRLRKDRYSALLLANAIGREVISRVVENKYEVLGGVARNLAKKDNKRQIEIGDGYSYGFGIKRGRMI